MRKKISFINKKKIRLVLAAIGLVAALTACGDKIKTTGENKSSIEAELTENREETKNTQEIEKTTTTKENSGEDYDSTSETTKNNDEKSDDNRQSETTKKSDSQNTTKQNQTKETTGKVVNETTKQQNNIPQQTTKSTNNTQQQTTKAQNNTSQQETTAAPTVDYGNIDTTGDVTTVAKNVVKSIITNSMNQEQKVRAMHDYIVKPVRYEISDNREIYTAKGALVNKVAVCQGYALAFKALCDEAGIQCEMVYGTGNSGGQSISHAWNVVCVDGQWYQIDVTWDDPITSGLTEEECQKGANLSYAYYLIPDAVMYMDHTADKSISNISDKICKSTKYEKTSYYISSADDFSNLVYNAISASGKQTTYEINLQCLKGEFAQYFTQDTIFSILNNGVTRYGNGYANGVQYTMGGNGKYDFSKVTFTVVWR